MSLQTVVNINRLQTPPDCVPTERHSCSSTLLRCRLQLRPLIIVLWNLCWLLLWLLETRQPSNGHRSRRVGWFHSLGEEQVSAATIEQMFLSLTEAAYVRYRSPGLAEIAEQLALPAVDLRTRSAMRAGIFKCAMGFKRACYWVRVASAVVPVSRPPDIDFPALSPAP